MRIEAGKKKIGSELPCQRRTVQRLPGAFVSFLGPRASFLEPLSLLLVEHDIGHLVRPVGELGHGEQLLTDCPVHV